MRRRAGISRSCTNQYGCRTRTARSSAGVRRLSPRAVKALKTGDEFAAQLAIVRFMSWCSWIGPKMRVERGSEADLFNFGATYGSVFPAIELMMLAARAVGVGTAMTTMLTSKESETKTLLGVPEQYQLIALVPMGYPADGFQTPRCAAGVSRASTTSDGIARGPISDSLPHFRGEG